MRIPIHHVDAFSLEVFGGNPAAVVVLERWLDDHLLGAIAAENNLSETAFLVRTAGAEGEESGADFRLRWFTPTVEVDLCGHATLASGHVLMRELGWEKPAVRFMTRSGVVGVEREGERLVLDFPVVPVVGGEVSGALVGVLGARPREVVLADMSSGTPGKLVAVFEHEEEVRNMSPDFRAMMELEGQGRGSVIVTAPGSGGGEGAEEVDFVSRFFVPAAGIDEDPVTGSAHCVLVSYWGARLGKSEMRARQVSARGGELWLKVVGDRVRIGGDAVTYLRGEIVIPDGA